VLAGNLAVERLQHFIQQKYAFRCVIKPVIAKQIRLGIPVHKVTAHLRPHIVVHLPDKTILHQRAHPVYPRLLSLQQHFPGPEKNLMHRPVLRAYTVRWAYRCRNSPPGTHMMPGHHHISPRLQVIAESPETEDKCQPGNKQCQTCDNLPESGTRLPDNKV